MGETVVLDNVRLTLGAQRFAFDGTFSAGRITALSGRSGSGKTTLLNLIAGFDEPDSGSVLIGGRDVTRLHPAERAISVIFQDNNLFAHLDIFTNIGLGIHPGLRLDTGDRQKISDALLRVGLAGFERRKPATLSGGERQRVAFARALVRNRPVLLMDEPFASLDQDLRAVMADLLLDLHRDMANTIVIVSHDPDEIVRLADDVLLVKDHRLQPPGTAAVPLGASADES